MSDFIYNPYIMQLLTRKELAERLKQHPNTIYNWTRWGQIRSHKLGPRQVRYVLAEVMEDLGIEVI